MEKPSFYSKLWRFNAVVITLAGTGALLMVIIGLIVLAIDFVGDMTRGISRQNIVNVEDSIEIKEDLVYGDPSVVTGTNFMKVPLNTSQSYERGGSSYGSKETISTRNFLFYNLQTQTYRWLINHNHYLMKSNPLHAEPTLEFRQVGELETAVKAHAYQVVKADTNGDKRLTFNDDITYALSKPDGSEYVELIEDIYQVLDIEYMDDNTYAVMYRKTDDMFVATIDVDRLALIRNAALPAY